MAEKRAYTKHQQGVIKRYYDNQDTILRQRLAELVTELYLAEGKKSVPLWERVAATLEKLNVPRARIDHILTQNDVKLLAKLVTELQD